MGTSSFEEMIARIGIRPKGRAKIRGTSKLENTVLHSVSCPSKIRVLDGVLCFCLPYFIGEVSFAKTGRMTEGSLYTHGDPSVLISTNTKGVLLDPPPSTKQGRQTAGVLET
jgi:hypothetical protein